MVPQQANVMRRTGPPPDSGPGIEEATFRFTVTNTGDAPAKIMRAHFVPLSVQRDDYDVATLVYYPSIEHDGDTTVLLNDAQPNTRIVLPVSFTVPMHGGMEHFGVWFRANNFQRCGYLRVTGRVILFDDSGRETNETIKIVISSDRNPKRPDNNQ